MWINKYDEPIPTYGNNGKEFLLYLKFHEYFGHLTQDSVVITAVWDSLNEAFYDVETGKEIMDEDIFQWWKEDK